MNRCLIRLKTSSFFLFGWIGLLLGVLTFFVLPFRAQDSRLQKVNESYRQGESALTLFAKQESFNAALALLLTLDAQYHPHFGNGILSYDIGNTYFQLGEYPLSILYYKRAENLMPRSEAVKRNLLQVRKKIGIKTEEKKKLVEIVTLKSYLSIPERLQVASLLALFTLFFSSAWLWSKKQGFLNITVLLLLPLTVLLLNLTVSYYFSPIEGVFIQAAQLRRDAGIEFAKVSDQPIPGGTLVEVIHLSPNGKWFKVALSSGEFGYVPSEAIRLVDL